MANHIMKREVTIAQVVKMTAFAKANKDVFTDKVKYLTASGSANNRMLAVENELKQIMPNILGVSSDNQNWTTLLKEYFNNFSLTVPVGGKRLDISFVYDIDDNTKPYISRVKNITTSKELAEWVENPANKVPEEDKVFYGKPVEAKDYVAWRYAKYSNKVANSIEDSYKSPNIDFYLIDKDIIEKQKKMQIAVFDDALEVYAACKKDSLKLDALLLVLEVDTDDKLGYLSQLVKDNPAPMVKAFKDKLLMDKAVIIKYINAGLLNKLPNSGLIVDASEQDVIIGNTLEEASINIKSDLFKVRLSQYEARIKNLK